MKCQLSPKPSLTCWRRSGRCWLAPRSPTVTRGIKTPKHGPQSVPLAPRSQGLNLMQDDLKTTDPSEGEGRTDRDATLLSAHLPGSAPRIGSPAIIGVADAGNLLGLISSAKGDAEAACAAIGCGNYELAATILSFAIYRLREAGVLKYG